MTSVCASAECVSPPVIHFISVWIVTVFHLLLFIKRSHLLTFTLSLYNKTSRKYNFHRGGGKKKNRQEKQMLWDQWCKKLFLSNAAWLTFPADTDKRMGASRTFCVVVCLCSLGERRRGRENKWDYWCYMSNIIAEIWAKRRRGAGWWARWSVECFIWEKGQQVTEFGLWPPVCIQYVCMYVILWGNEIA